jgi:protein-tyrosine phosphatase
LAAAPDAAPPPGILLVCTANICRSPMGAALLRRRLCDLGVPAVVESAGLYESGRRVTEQAVRLLATRGIDVSGHVSSRLDADRVRSATLVIGMEPRHVQEAVLLEPDAWPRSFVLKELVRRSEAIGARTAEPLGEWLARAQLGRSPKDLLIDSGNEIADPYGRSDDAYRDTVEELDALLTRFADLAWGRARS